MVELTEGGPSQDVDQEDTREVQKRGLFYDFDLAFHHCPRVTCRRPSLRLYQNNSIKPILGAFNTIIITPMDH